MTKKYEFMCPICGKVNTLELDSEKYNQWKMGAHVQDVFPDLTPDERELIITGTCSKCWDKMFGEDEE